MNRIALLRNMARAERRQWQARHEWRKRASAQGEQQPDSLCPPRLMGLSRRFDRGGADADADADGGRSMDNADDSGGRDPRGREPAAECGDEDPVDGSASPNVLPQVVRLKKPPLAGDQQWAMMLYK